MERLLLSATLVAASLRFAYGQAIPQNSNGSAVPIWGLATLLQGGTSPLCNATFADTNGTGVWYANPNVPQGPQAGQPDNYSGRTLGAGVAVTLQNPGFNSGNTSNHSSSYTLWYDTNGANYADRYALGYDVCALVGFSLNYNTQLRGQNDTGDCTQTLDQPCISAIKETVQQYAMWLTTPSPGPNSNLTNSSLPSVCRLLSSMLVENFPDECSYFFGEKLSGIAYPLTSYGDEYESGLTSNCTMNGTFQNTLTFYNNDSQSIYTAWADSVTPAIGVWMPIADAGAQTTITEAVAEIFCGHITNINEGSYQPADLPQPTPVAYNATSNSTSSGNTTVSSSASSTPQASGGGLSGGAIAGIVVGVIVLLALLAGLAAWLWRKKRQQQHNASSGHVDAPPAQPMAEVSGETSHYELGGHSARTELPTPKDEGGKDYKLYRELEGMPVRSPVELPAH